MAKKLTYGIVLLFLLSVGVAAAQEQAEEKSRPVRLQDRVPTCGAILVDPDGLEDEEALCRGSDSACDELASRQELWRSRWWMATKRRAELNQKIDKAEEGQKDNLRNSFKGELDELTRCVKKIDHAVVTPNLDRLRKRYSDVPRWMFGLQGGYEFVSVDKYFDDGEPLIGMTVQTRFLESQPDRRYGWAPYGLHQMFNARLGSNREGAADEDGQPQDDDESSVKQTFSFDLEHFFPLMRTEFWGGEDVRVWSGPIVVLGGKLEQESEQVSARYYGGWRGGIGPSHYSDILLGKTEGLDGLRLEVRGQMALAEISGHPVFLGAVGNFGLESQSSRDTVTVYASWQTDPASVFGGMFE